MSKPVLLATDFASIGRASSSPVQSPISVLTNECSNEVFFCYSLRACITKTFHIVKQENITLPRDRHQYSCVISFHPVLGSWYSFFFIIINYGVVFPGVYCCLPTFYGSKKKKSQIGMFCGWARGKLLQISSVLIPPWPNNVSIVFNESR